MSARWTILKSRAGISGAGPGLREARGEGRFGDRLQASCSRNTARVLPRTISPISRLRIGYFAATASR